MLQRSRTRVSAEGHFSPVNCLCSNLASTEPHSCECGRFKLTHYRRFPDARLQRSRTRVSAEGDGGGYHRSPSGDASTEPHSCECGRHPAAVVTGTVFIASTEPHSCECGRQREKNPAGHGSREASTEPHSCECGRNAKTGDFSKRHAMLQRSRTRVSAEGADVRGGGGVLRAGFNGAALV